MLRVHSVPGNRQWLDGGSMFGNAPRALWERLCKPDPLGRIELACRALLVEDGRRRVLLEAGIGAFFEPKLRERYGVVETEHVLLQSLGRRGLADADVDVVVLSHLHFDHAGGLLAPYEPDEPRRLLFPRARFVVSRVAYERAKDPHPRDRASFIPELAHLLEETGRLHVVDEGERPADLLDDRYAFTRTNGHTPGMLHTTIRGAHQSVFFCADLVPGSPWVHLPLTMGYDRAPELLVDEKTEAFERLLAADSWLFFTHDVNTCAARLVREGGRYALGASLPEGASWDLDE